MENVKNQYSPYRNYFVKSIDYNQKKVLNKIKNGFKAIYSAEAYKKLTKLINETKPDIAHVNLFCHQLTPSILFALKKADIPIVYTSHDYKLICANYKLFNHDSVCRKCIKGSFRHCLMNKCHKDSLAASGIVTLESYIYKFLNTYHTINKIICPSHFMYNVLNEAGYDKSRLVMLHNFLDVDIFKSRLSVLDGLKSNTVLYVGRLSDEKGLDTLLDASKMLPREINIRIIGIGPMEEHLKQRIKDEALENIELGGFVSGRQLYNEIRAAKCTVIPSKCYEIFGLTIIESFAMGTPVIGSDIGGISELIRPGRTGYLFEAGNAEELSYCVSSLLQLDNDNYQVMVRNCVAESVKYSPDSYYNELLKVYESAIEHKLKYCGNY